MRAAAQLLDHLSATGTAPSDRAEAAHLVEQIAFHLVTLR
jgi:hypothetical protein